MRFLCRNTSSFRKIGFVVNRKTTRNGNVIACWTHLLGRTTAPSHPPLKLGKGSQNDQTHTPLKLTKWYAQHDHKPSSKRVSDLMLNLHRHQDKPQSRPQSHDYDEQQQRPSSSQQKHQQGESTSKKATITNTKNWTRTTERRTTRTTRRTTKRKTKITKGTTKETTKTTKGRKEP